MEIRKTSPRRACFVYDAELGHFTFFFCRGRQRNVQGFIMHVQSYCFAFETLSFWRSSRCRCRRGLHKLLFFCTTPKCFSYAVRLIVCNTYGTSMRSSLRVMFLLKCSAWKVAGYPVFSRFLPFIMEKKTDLAWYVFVEFLVGRLWNQFC